MSGNNILCLVISQGMSYKTITFINLQKSTAFFRDKLEMLTREFVDGKKVLFYQSLRNFLFVFDDFNCRPLVCGGDTFYCTAKKSNFLSHFAQCDKRLNFFFLQTNGLQLIMSSKKNTIMCSSNNAMGPSIKYVR